MNNQVIKKVLFATIIVGIATIVVVKIVTGFKSINTQLAQKQYFTEALSSEDSSLFKISAWRSLKVKQAYHLEEENPLDFLSYGGFELVLYKFDMKGNANLPKALLFENKSATTATGVTYATFQLSDFLTYKFQPGMPRGLSRLHLTIYGDSLKYDSGEAVMAFALSCKNISIRCDESEAVQIFVTGNEGLLGVIEPAPLELKFLTRGRSIYMLILTPRDKKNSITSDLLKSILN